MRCWSLSLVALVAACEAFPTTAPITYKTSQAGSVLIDGVPLGVLCELAERVGTEYIASDIPEEEAKSLEAQRTVLDLLDTAGAICGGSETPLDIPFTADADRRIVSTWSEFALEEDQSQWGSCVADTARAANNRVVFCEISSALDASAASSSFKLVPAQ